MIQKCIFYFIIISLFQWKIQSNKRTLVLIDHPIIEKTHSDFFDTLRERKYTLDFHKPDDKNYNLKSFGELNYDNIIFFSPKSKNYGNLKISDVVDFVEKGGNVLITCDYKTSNFIRKLTAESGVLLEKKKKGIIIDHINHLVENNTINDIHDSIILTNSFIKSKYVVGNELATNKNNDPIAFRGINQYIDNDNILAFSALKASNTAYLDNPSSNGNSNTESVIGNDISLVSCIQGRNNARIVVFGSIDMFHNKYNSLDLKLNNKNFVHSLTKWNFQESGVLRVHSIHHYCNDNQPPEKMLHSNYSNRPDLPETYYPDPEIARDSLVYRIKDNLTYSFIIQELTLDKNNNKKWIGFKADDLQLEFVMLDPYVRKTMQSNRETGKFSVTFEAPDQYGIFNFRVLYRRIGLSTIFLTTQVTLRPFKHNEYERFIQSAYPYYASMFSMMAGLFILTIIFLYGNEK